MRIKLRQNRSSPVDISPVVYIRNEELCMITHALFLNYIERTAPLFLFKTIVSNDSSFYMHFLVSGISRILNL